MTENEILKNAVELTDEEMDEVNGGAHRTSAQYYVIQKGDTLASITHRFSITIQKLMSLNPKIVNPNKIHAGDRIRVK